MTPANPPMEPDPHLEETVFAAALQRTHPADRAAFLDQACAGNPELRRRVEALLSAGEQANTFLEQPAGIDDSPTTADPDPSAPSTPSTPPDSSLRFHPRGPDSTEGPGSRIGRYRLLQQIGEGGCGTVFMAEQEEPVRRRVALKLIKLGMDTRSVIARFEAERQALAMMDHPHIARVLDAGATASGRPFFVMELVRGIPITRFCDDNRLNTRQRLELFTLVCQAVQHAHQKGIIHRDLKPSNILVTLHDGKPVPKVIDFGIAKATEGRLTDRTLFTAFEQFIGTPAYMSPEQAGLSGLDVDTRSDIYSLGVLLYELLTGRTPFDARELAQAGLDEIRRRIREVEPARPSTRLSTLQGDAVATTASARGAALPELVHLLRGDLDWIVMRCLEKDRVRRYETANGLAADIHRHLSDEPVSARPPSTVYRFQKAWRRNRTAFTVAGAFVLLLVTATGVSAWQAIRATRAENRSGELLTKSELARRDYETVINLLVSVFQSPDPNRNGRTVTVAESLDAATERLAADESASPSIRAQLQTAFAQTYAALGLHESAVNLQRSATEYLVRDLGPDDPKAWKANVDLGVVCFKAGHQDEGIRLVEPVVAASRKNLGALNYPTLPYMELLGTMLHEARRTEEALRLREEIIDLNRKFLGAYHFHTLDITLELAFTYDQAGRLDDALRLRTETLEISRRRLGPEHPTTLRAMDSLALSHEFAGRSKEELAVRLDLVEQARKVFPAESPTLLGMIMRLGLAYSREGRGDEGIRLLREALEPARRRFGPEHPDLVMLNHNLGSLLAEAGRMEEARPLLEDALKIARQHREPGHLETLAAMNDLASFLSRTGERDRGIALQEECVASGRVKPGMSHPDIIRFLANLGNLYARADRHEQALAVREEVAAIRRRTQGTNALPRLEAELRLAQSLRQSGRTEEAVALARSHLDAIRNLAGPTHPLTQEAENLVQKTKDDPSPEPRP